MINLPKYNLSLLILWLTIFIVMDMTILGLNIWISIEIDKDAAAINIAGRQRMLSQRMTKEILSIDHPQIQISDHSRENLIELERSFLLFDQTLLAFQRGGVVLGTEGAPVTLYAPEGDDIRKVLEQALTVWHPLKLQFSKIFSTENDISAETIADIRNYALAHNGELLSLMNDLTSTVENTTKAKTQRIRLFQIIAMMFALMSFIVVVFQTFQRFKLIRQNEYFLDSIVDNIDACVLIHTETGQITNSNKRFTELFGFQQDVIIGRNIKSLVKKINEEMIGQRKDGSSFFASVEHNTLIINNTPIVITTVRDISPQKTTERTLTRMAYYDPLTKLPNRTLMRDRITQGIGHANRSKKMVAIFFIDLDGFKAVNDSAGHEAGDLLLTEVAKILKSSIRQSDSVGRWGGDEFVLVYMDVDSIAVCKSLAQEIIELISGITQVQNKSIQLGASLGISLYPSDTNDADTLVALADAAMYEAKKFGKNNYQFHHIQEEAHPEFRMFR